MMFQSNYDYRERIDIKEGEIAAAEKLGYSVVSANGSDSCWQITDPQGRKTTIFASYMMTWQIIINGLRTIPHTANLQPETFTSDWRVK